MTATVAHGLECQVRLGRIVVPLPSVDKVGRYRVGARLPAAQQHVAGLGAWDDQLVISLSLSETESAPDRECTGILLRTSTPSSLRWALEVVAPIGGIEVTQLSPAPGAAERAAWLRTATVRDGRTLVWVAVDEMIAAVGSRPDLGRAAQLGPRGQR